MWSPVNTAAQSSQTSEIDNNQQIFKNMREVLVITTGTRILSSEKFECANQKVSCDAKNVGAKSFILCIDY